MGGGVQKGARFYRQEIQWDIRRHLLQSPGGLLCLPERFGLFRQEVRRQGHKNFGRSCRLSPGEGPGRGGPRIGLRRRPLHPPLVRHLHGKDPEGAGPNRKGIEGTHLRKGRLMAFSGKKLEHLKKLSTKKGIIAAAAMDQRGSLKKSIAKEKGVDPAQVTAGMMEEFKTAVTKILSPHASAILLDPEFGLPASR